MMSDAQNQFEFTGVILREGAAFSSLCLDLDIASQGKTVREAKKALTEAVTLYLETCFENGIPHLRPVPPSDDPRQNSAKNLLEVFSLRVNFQVYTLA